MTDGELGKPCNMKPVNQTPVKVRRKFDTTFKREAVNNWLASGKAAGVVAQELGLRPSRLYAWKVRFAPAAAGGERRRGQSPGRWPICRASWTPPCARTGTCANSGTF